MVLTMKVFNFLSSATRSNTLELFYQARKNIKYYFQVYILEKIIFAWIFLIVFSEENGLDDEKIPYSSFFRTSRLCPLRIACHNETIMPPKLGKFQTEPKGLLMVYYFFLLLLKKFGQVHNQNYCSLQKACKNIQI